MAETKTLTQKVRWHWKIPYGDYWGIDKKQADRYSTYLLVLVVANIFGWPAAVLLGLYEWTGDVILAFAGWLVAQFLVGSVFGRE